MQVMFVNQMTKEFLVLIILLDGNYKIVSVSGEDYLYHEDDIISFSNEIIVNGVDSLIELFTFNPTHNIDSTEIVKDTTTTEGGSLTLKTDFIGNVIVQLLRGNKVILQEVLKTSLILDLKILLRENMF